MQFSNKYLSQVTFNKCQTISRKFDFSESEAIPSYFQLIRSILDYLSLPWLFRAVMIDDQVSIIKYQVLDIGYQEKGINYKV